MSTFVAPAAKPSTAAGPPPLQYEVPQWADAAVLAKGYSLDVLKSGILLETLSFDAAESYVVVGRLPTCPISLEHASVSRQHAVFQFGSHEGCDASLYDLGSAHGTFLNKTRVQPRSYYPLQDGDQVKFGASTRTFVWKAPADIALAQATLREAQATDAMRSTVSNMHDARQRQRAQQQQQDDAEEEVSITRAATWGQTEDVPPEEEEEGDQPRAGESEDVKAKRDSQRRLALRAVVEDEEHAKYAENPRQYLRNWLEARHLPLEFDVSGGGGQEKEFITILKVPSEMDDEDIVVQGAALRKKDAEVHACLLALREMTVRGWFKQQKMSEAGSFSSCSFMVCDGKSKWRGKTEVKRRAFLRKLAKTGDDEDDFYDRTSNVVDSAVAPTRAPPQKAETFESLTAQIDLAKAKIPELEHKIQRLQQQLDAMGTPQDANEDDLEAYMAHLDAQNQSKEMTLQKEEAVKQLQEQQALLKRTERLIQYVTPALPTLPAVPSLPEATAPMEPIKRDADVSLKTIQRQEDMTVVENMPEDDAVPTPSQQEVTETEREEETVDIRVQRGDPTLDHQDPKEKSLSAGLNVKKRSAEEVVTKASKVSRQADPDSRTVREEDESTYAPDQTAMWVPPSAESDKLKKLREKLGY